MESVEIDSRVRGNDGGKRKKGRSSDRPFAFSWKFTSVDAQFLRQEHHRILIFGHRIVALVAEFDR